MKRGSGKALAGPVAALLPAALAAALPKCPACLIAWGAIVTGVSLPISAVSGLRTGLIAASVAILFAMGLLAFRRRRKPAPPGRGDGEG